MTATVPADSTAPALSVVRTNPGVDLAAAERAATALLESLGVDVHREGMAATPGRMVRAYAELFSPPSFDLTTFPNTEGYDELVLARDIPFESLCAHHMLPFHGVAHVGYIPDDRILGLSKLARIVELFGKGLQVQERLTQQVAGWLAAHLQAKGVGVVLRAEHMCMTLRGVQAVGSSTVTSALHGWLREDAGARAEFFSLAGLSS